MLKTQKIYELSEGTIVCWEGQRAIVLVHEGQRFLEFGDGYTMPVLMNSAIAVHHTPVELARKYLGFQRVDAPNG